MSVAIQRAILLKTRTEPTEIVDAGEAYFFLDGASIKYKDSSQVVRTLATGVSPEDVQDIIGTFITSGNSRLTVNYNDAGNSLVLTVVEANIVHQNLSGAGINTHAQIDSHIANVSNPHNTTKAQVGLGNVDNTSDVDKPVSTAQATAIANAQSFSIQRANHTGTQTASTISDFAEAAQDAVGSALVDSATIDFTYNDAANQITAGVIVAAVNHDALQNFVANEHIDHSNVSILAGTGLQGGGNITADRTLSLTNTGVTAGVYGAGAVPQLTVDAQGRITAASNGPALAIGDNFEQFSDLTAFTTTANTNQVAAVFTSSIKQPGVYRIEFSWDWTYNSTTSDAIFVVFVDGVQVSQEFRKELSETTTQVLNNMFWYYPDFATTQTHTLQLLCRSEAAGSTVTVSQVRAAMWRMQP